MESRSAVGMRILMGITMGMGMGGYGDRNSVPTAALMESADRRAANYEAKWPVNVMRTCSTTMLFF